MNCVNYLCIDDQPIETIKPLLDSIEGKNKNLQFTRIHPNELGSQITNISAMSKKFDYFGLLVDLRLDMDPDPDGRRVVYRGPTLAQELRTRMAESDDEIVAFPIILWSVNQKLKSSHFSNASSNNLFDMIVNKDDIGCHNLDIAMESLARGYKKIKPLAKKNRINTTSLLDLNDFDELSIDPRLIDGLKKSSSISEIASYILKKVVEREGVLIDEETLAARLGVDISRSNSAWTDLLSMLKSTKYSGIFSDGWGRWWWHRVESWWGTLNGRKGTIRRIGASSRVEVLNNNLNLNLIPADIAVIGYSDKFYTLCKATKKPIDTIDGVRILHTDIVAWEDPSYVSIDAVLNRINRELWTPDPLERARIAELKSRA